MAGGSGRSCVLPRVSRAAWGVGLQSNTRIPVLRGQADEKQEVLRGRGMASARRPWISIYIPARVSSSSSSCSSGSQPRTKCPCTDVYGRSDSLSSSSEALREG